MRSSARAMRSFSSLVIDAPGPWNVPVRRVAASDARIVGRSI
jgi:hypothetical protein